MRFFNQRFPGGLSVALLCVWGLVLPGLLLPGLAAAAPGDDVPEGLPKPSMTGIVPQGVGFGLALPSLNESEKRSKEFLASMKLERDPQLKMLLGIGLNYITGVRTSGIDQDKPLALIVPTHTAINTPNPLIENGGADLFDYTQTHAVGIVPVTDRKLFADSLGKKPVDIRDGVMHKIGDRHLLIRNDYAYVGRNASTVDIIAHQEPMRGVLSRQQAAEFDSAELFVPTGQPLWIKFWQNFFAEALDNPVFKDDPRAEEAMRQLRSTGEAVQYGAFTVQLHDTGLQLGLTTVFDQTKQERVAEFLTALAAGPQISGLQALPADDFPLVAYAAKGKGTENVSIARGLLRLGLSALPGGQELLTGESREKLAAVYSEVWQQLNGSRAAVYQEQAPSEDNDFNAEVSAVAILDLDPKEFLEGLPQMVKALNEAAADAAAAEQVGPILSYKPEAEEISGLKVGHLILNLKNLPGDYAELQKQFGPQGNRIRLVPVGDHLVMFLGSKTKRLETTITNIRENKPGLAEHPRIQEANKHLPRLKKLEFHYAIMDSPQNISDKPLENTVAADGSTAMGIGPEGVEFTVWMPQELARMFLAQFGY